VKNLETETKRRANRRSFLKGGLATASVTAGLLGSRSIASAQSSGSLSSGDVAILQFVAAAEIIESDMWQQYAELGGVTSGAPNPYQNALAQMDGDGSQYISSNTLDEQSHENFLNAYLVSKGAPAVNFSKFKTLPSSKATGARQVGRLTNLMQLTVDTSWFIRYRSQTNPDFGATYPQAVPDLKLGQFPGIPRTNADFGPTDHIQAIANTAAFHFGMIEQGGSSLYPTLGQNVTDAEVLRIMFSIGGDEVAHFLEWVDFAGNSVAPPIAPLTDPTNGLTFPDLADEGIPQVQTNLIFPVPCEFISPNLPKCAVIRPTGPGQIDAMGAVNGFIGMGIFLGQPTEFLDILTQLAQAADAAKRS